MKGYVQDVGYIDFYGNPIVTTYSEDHGYLVPMKHVVEDHLGLNWERQREKLNSVLDIIDAEGESCEIYLYNPVNISGDDISAGVNLEHEFEEHVIPIFKSNASYTCLPLSEFNHFLNSINVRKVKPEMREMLLTYQQECMTALHDYWMHGFAINDHKVSSQINSGRSDFDPRESTTVALQRSSERYSKFALRNFEVEVSPDDITGFAKASIFELLRIDDEVWDNLGGALNYMVAYMETTAYNIIHFSIDKGISPDDLPEILITNIENRLAGMQQKILKLESPYSAFPGVGRGAKRELD